MLRQRALRRGLSVVELMVGMAIGLFVVASALLMFANLTNDNRMVLQETRVAQDLRATADLIARDLRRAGYWGNATAGVWAVGMAGLPATNPYTLMSATPCASATLDAKTTASASASICYAVAQDGNNAVDANDRFGFELDGGVVYAVMSGAQRQALSDPRTLTITDLVITPSSQVLPASEFCSKTCTVNCPEVVVREFEVLIKGNLPGNPGVTRFQRSNVRVRNDYFAGVCPT